MKIVIERDTEVEMRDGVRLSADIYRSDSGEPSPALLHRLPYGKNQPGIVSSLLIDPIAAVERGYSVVVQDTRGTGSSQGELRPIFSERADGHDTIRWVAAQDWCDGSVGLYGSSYMGLTTLQATVDAPDALKASLAYITSASFHDTWCYNGGVFELGFQLRWSLNSARRQLARLPEGGGSGKRAAELLHRFAADPQSVFASGLDVRSLARDCAELMPWYEEFASQPPTSARWDPVNVTKAADRIRVPVMSVAGWYDAFLKSGLDLFSALVTRGPESLRSEHRLLVGPWDHNAYFGMETLSHAGSRNFGPAAAGGQPGLQQTALSWFDRWLRGRPGDRLQVRYFDMGPDTWADSPTWPPAGVTEELWYLHSTGQADTLGGVLSRDKPTLDEPADSYIYDPLDPAPTHGGRHMLPYLAGGVQDQRVITGRPDVLTYQSARLTATKRLAGPVRVSLHYSSSAPASDFFAVLLDIGPDGKAENVADGIRRVSGSGPDGTCEIDLWDTAYQFGVGHRIGLSITGSCFPRYARSADGAAANVRHSPGAPSALVLTVRS